MHGRSTSQGRWMSVAFVAVERCTLHRAGERERKRERERESEREREREKEGGILCKN